VNLVFPITGDDLKDPNVVKVVVNNDFNINFFSRSHIPFNSVTTFRQLGMIGFTNKALQYYSDLFPTPLEEIESIDMMRFLENDFSIQGVLSSSPILGVDNPEDIVKAEKMMLGDELIHLYKEKYI
jgi:3-deoxy-manno-octulosonate cytidylyltransferase (CMP-KDO synthetase)